jgi:hypothetical protein
MAVKFVTVTPVTDGGVELDMVVAAKRTFSTGSRGFYGQGEVIIDGRPHKVTLQLFEKGSKPADPPAKKGK